MKTPIMWAGLLLGAISLVFLAAGTWQMRRAHYKDELQASLVQTAAAPPLALDANLLSAEAANLRRTLAIGQWRADKSIFLDNKVQDGVVGYEVITPLQISGTEIYVLVNRGWIKAPRLRSDLPTIATPAGEQQVSGTARISNARFIELSEQKITGTVWQNLTVERYQAWSGLRLQPFVLYQSGNSADGLQRVLPAPEAAGINADRHRGYALTWFGLAGVTIVLGALAWRKSTSKVK